MAKELNAKPFQYGAEYTVQENFFDPFNGFKAGEKLIFLNTEYIRNEGYFGYFFYNLGDGKIKSWNIYDNDPKAHQQLNSWQEIFKTTGGWTEPLDEIVHEPLNDFDLSSRHAALNRFIPYFKNIAEGVEGIENWFLFFKRYSLIFEKVVSRGELLRWKKFPYDEIINFLGEARVKYHPHIRYQWLSLKKIHRL